MFAVKLYHLASVMIMTNPDFRFELLAATAMTRFEPIAFIGGGDVVVVLLNLTCAVRATGMSVVYEDGVMVCA